MFSGAIVAAISLSTPTLTWGDYAHRVIAEIALRSLTPAASHELDLLLGSEASISTPYCPVVTLGDASVWADCVRTRYKEQFAQLSRRRYINVDVCGTFTLAGCNDGQCVTAALKRQLAVLGDRRAAREARVMALNWEAHLTGDLHQPLHVADNGDRGGNQVEVQFGDRRSRYRQNLHGIWDRDLAELAVETMPVSSAAAEIRETVASSAAGSIDDWAQETWGVARTSVYGPLLAERCISPAMPIVIDVSYARQATPVIQLQIRRAGSRLATLLNRALD